MTCPTAVATLAIAVSVSVGHSQAQSQKNEVGVRGTDIDVGSTNGRILHRAIAGINAAGGIHGRKIILHSLGEACSFWPTIVDAGAGAR
jgi:hypothetical protein